MNDTLSIEERKQLAGELSNALAVSLVKPEKPSLWHIEAALRTAVEEWQDAVQWLAEYDESKLLQDAVPRDEVVANVARTEAALKQCLAAEVRKVSGVCHVMRSWMAEIAEANAEKRRIARLEQVKQNALDRLKGFVLSVMQEMDEAKLKGSTDTLRRQKNPPSLEIFDALQVPEEYMEITVKMPLAQWRRVIATVPEPCALTMDLKEECVNEAIRAALKAGIKVPGARMTQGEHLRIG